MSKYSVCFTGFTREDEAVLASQFEQANARLGQRWRLAAEADAAVLIIDMDSMYGHMTWLKARNSGRITVAVTSGSRAETDHRLSRPTSADALAELLGQLADLVPEASATPAPAAAPIAAPVSAAPPAAPAPAAAPVESNARTTAEVPATTMTARQSGQMPAMTARMSGQMPAMPAREPRLSDYLRPGNFPGPVKLQVADAPLLVLDPNNQTYLGGPALKPFQAYATATVQQSDFHPIDAAELASLTTQLAGTQPWSRLAWLCALLGGKGSLAAGFDPNQNYKLSKWPQTEREFPKHFRIATVMMKGPAKLTDIAEQSGVPLADVIDFVNASLATGYAGVA